MSLFNNKEKKIKKFRSKHKIGLCLSGGGTKGFSYIGAFKALEESNIKFDMVAGTSVGSLFGALYASGFTSEQMINIAKNVKTSDFRKSKLGFLPSKTDALAENLNSVLKIKNIEKLPMPYFAVACNLRTGKEVRLNEGNLISAITGSCAIPGVFCPVKHKDMLLIDGGVVNNVPVDVLKENGCEYVVTIDCNSSRGGGTQSNSLITQFVTSIGITMVNNSKKGIELSDIIIRPDTKMFNSLKINNVEELIEAGYIATKQAMQQIENLLMGKLK